ncbi:MAG: type IV pili twitching motility protein PilT, partial [Planctomycetota bacterium]|nr:type IV pili twitching motility protein PilT [Planctomycetota bacterium]
AVRNIIRESRTFEIPNVIETSRSVGMISLDASITELCRRGCISQDDALARAVSPGYVSRQLAA